MRRPILLIFIGIGLLSTAACPTKMLPEPLLPTLTITSPTNGSYTNSSSPVDINVVSSNGPAPNEVSLLLDGTVFKVVEGPPYDLSWSTTTVPEGPHTLIAQASVGDQTVASEPVTLTIDRTAPQVLTTVPATGASSVVLRAPITVTFSEAIAAGSLSPSTVTLSINGTPVSTTLTVATDSMGRSVVTIHIEDLTSFGLPAPFSVVLSNGITDLAGNPLAVSAAVWSWTVPDYIQFGSLSSYTRSLLAVGPNFLPTVTVTGCIEVQPGCEYVVSVSASDGQGWNPVGQLSNVFGDDAGLDLDAQGNPVVVGTDSTGTQLLVATWKGTSWDSTIPPPVAPSGSGFEQEAVRVDASGNLVVGYIQQTTTTPTKSDVFVSRWNGTQWTALGEIGQTTVNRERMILDAQGNPVVGWSAGNAGGFMAWSGTAWNGSNSYYFPTSDPFVALDSSGAVSMVTNQYPIEVDHYEDGLWSAEISTSVPTNTGVASPTLAMTSDHHPVVAWVDTTNSEYAICFSRWTGTAWTTQAAAGFYEAPEQPATEAPALVVDARDTVWIAWREATTTYVWMSNY